MFLFMEGPLLVKRSFKSDVDGVKFVKGKIGRGRGSLDSLEYSHTRHNGFMFETPLLSRLENKGPMGMFKNPT